LNETLADSGKTGQDWCLIEEMNKKIVWTCPVNRSWMV